MAHLKDIAQACGVSIRTVSRALKGNGYVSQPVRNKVLEAAVQLGYQPNRIARSLKTSKSYEIAVIAWSVDELHMAKVASMEQVLRTNGYALNMVFGFQANAGPANGLDVVAELVQQKPAGIALFTGRIQPRKTAGRLLDARIPYVFFDCNEPEVDTVRIDRPRGVREAILHLAGKGYKRIAYLGSREDSSRLPGYHAAMTELGRAPILMDTSAGADDRMSSARRAGREFARQEVRPDAVQAYSDEVALSFMAGLYEAGVRVPDEVAIVGFDGRRAAMLASPPLTTVAQPNQEVGRVAAEILLNKIAGKSAPDHGWSCSVPTRLIVRESA